MDDNKSGDLNQHISNLTASLGKMNQIVGSISFKDVTLGSDGHAITKIITDSAKSLPNHQIHLERQVYGLFDKDGNLVGVIGSRNVLHDVTNDVGNDIVLLGSNIATGTEYSLAQFGFNTCLNSGKKIPPRATTSKPNNPLL